MIIGLVQALHSKRMNSISIFKKSSLLSSISIKTKHF
jgi:hypothetical protein